MAAGDPQRAWLVLFISSEEILLHIDDQEYVHNRLPLRTRVVVSHSLVGELQNRSLPKKSAATQ